MRRQILAPTLVALLFGLAVCEQATAQTDKVAYFIQEIRPLLVKNCLGCHGAEVQLGGLDLRSFASAQKGGTRGKTLVPGKAEKSLLYQVISGARNPAMPPTGKLPTEAVAKIKRWINAGAVWTEGTIDSATKQVWWAFVPPKLPPVPTHAGEPWVKTPIDAFVLTMLDANKLKPNPPAPRRVFIRRASLDLIGLLPTPQEVEAFVSDKSPKAFDKVVDRLLASPHYGERWARHWLDIVRYADSGGFEGDKDRPLLYKYRDYVIRAFNRDKPYNTFVREQLAGDEYAPNDPDSVIATGYLAAGPQDIVQKDAKTRSDELDDLVATTGQTFLGLTLGCARCHDHKYDPVKITDYYRLSAIFSPTERRELPVPTAEERRTIDRLNAEIKAQVKPFEDKFTPLWQKACDLAKQQKKPLTDENLVAVLSPADAVEYRRLSASIKEGNAKLKPYSMMQAITDKARTHAPHHLLLRGDSAHPGEIVEPGFICALPGGEATIPASAATSNTTGRRRALAEWLTAPGNPLPARVWVNRVWRQHFGRGLVNTPGNFGISGELPSHPELLDWLAVTFQRNGGHIKPIHRMILLSSVYQQSNVVRLAAAQSDPLNKWYWRMPLRRLEGEIIRDSILGVAGTLNPTQYGEPVYPPVDPSLRADTFQGVNWQEGEDSPKTWRRSIYIKVKRSLLFPSLEVFDCPEITASVTARNITTTPTQALTLLNDPLMQVQAQKFAERLRREVGNEPATQIERAYPLAFGREPTAKERTLALAFLKDRANGNEALTRFCHALFNLNEFVYSP